MLKKFLVLSMAILMIMSLFTAFPVAAAIVDLPENIGEDWRPGELTGNRYKSGSVYNPYAGPTFSYNKWTKTITISHDGALGDGLAAAKTERGAYGAVFSVTSNEFWIGEETFIFMVDAKKSSGNPRINFGVWQQAYPALMPIEYPTVSDGALVTNSDYQRYIFTVTVPKLAWNAASNVNFNFGLAETPAGETESDRSVKFDESSIYIGAEYANDIIVTAENTHIAQGGSTIIDADVLNQIGVVGQLDQSVTWYVTDATRTKKVSGITVAKRVDGKAILKVDSSVPVGEYCVVAVSDLNEDIVKGLKINVESTSAIAENSAVTQSNYSIISETIGNSIANILATYANNGKMLTADIVDTKSEIVN